MEDWSSPGGLEEPTYVKSAAVQLLEGRVATRHCDILLSYSFVADTRPAMEVNPGK